jgi:2'-5' RNA ligase
MKRGFSEGEAPLLFCTTKFVVVPCLHRICSLYDSRLFFGIQLSEESRSEIADTIQILRARPRPSGLRIAWTASENLHVTLKFLGTTNAELIEQTVSAARSALRGVLPFEIGIRRLGGFADLNSPRVLWVGVGDPSDLLGHMVQSLDRALEPLGFKPESRPYHGHITLARVKEGRGAQKIFDPMPKQEFGNCCVEEVILFETHTPSHGPVKYEPVARIHLK